MRKVALISAVLDNPQRCQRDFNDTIADYMYLIKGHMDVPLPEEGLSLVSLAVLGSIGDINSLTNQLGKIEGVSVKTAMSKRDF